MRDGMDERQRVLNFREHERNERDRRFADLDPWACTHGNGRHLRHHDLESAPADDLERRISDFPPWTGVCTGGAFAVEKAEKNMCAVIL